VLFRAVYEVRDDLKIQVVMPSADTQRNDMVDVMLNGCFSRQPRGFLIEESARLSVVIRMDAAAP
jgi:hypothetical protein